MTRLDLMETASDLAEAWRSRVLGRVGTASVKVLRMSEMPVEVEVHETDEALIVMDGRLELELGGRAASVTPGELCMVAAGTPHAVLPGSNGTLLIIEVEDGGA
jgi:mannose-6-phosphate isomerase-like protein (cupin superfamily)